MKKLSADVLVVGAGPAGAVAATVLADGGYRVLMVDDVRSTQRKIGESLPGAARPLLRHLQLDSALDPERHLTSFGNASAWGAPDLVTMDFIRDPNGLGWHVDRARFDASLRELAQCRGVEWLPARVRSVSGTTNDMQVATADHQIEARWIVDATGRRAFIACRSGAVVRRDDGLVALCAWIRPHHADPDMRSLVEATPTGWWYTAKVPSGERVVALFSDREDARAIKQNPVRWWALLADTVHTRALCEAADYLDGPRAMPASGAILDSIYGAGWVAAGDAALAFDPLSSQGIYNALYTGMKAGKALFRTLEGDPGALIEYAQEISRIRAAYVSHHRKMYAAERRFPQARFWRRRLEESLGLDVV